MPFSFQERRDILKNIIERSLRTLNPSILVKNSSEKIRSFIGNSSFSILATGKASVNMCRGIEQDILKKTSKAICLSPVGEDDPEGYVSLHGNHPYPDEDTLKSSLKIYNELMEDKAEKLIYLLSGGSSSLFEIPADGISLEKYNFIMKRLITENFSIDITNSVRCRVSKIKCGKLLYKTKYREVLILAISDVPDDKIYTIGSNPFYKPEVIGDIPDSIQKEFGISDEMEIGKESRIMPEYSIILSGSKYAEEVFNNFPVQQDRFNFGQIIKGDVELLAPEIMHLLRAKFNETGKPFWFVAHGESTARVRGKGKGGRNSYLSSLILKNSDSNEIFSFISFATDGADGNSGLAGFIVDEELRKTLDMKEIQSYIDSSNTAELAMKSGTFIMTGPTGNNVSDVIFGYYGGKVVENSVQ